MRFFSFLFACYIVVLTAVPCHDTFPTNRVITTVLAQQTSDQHHHMEDGCSPFCTCSCCTTPVVQTQQAISLDCHVEQRAVLVDLLVADPCSGTASIWQPPKIG